MQQEMLQEITKRIMQKYSLMNEIYVNTGELEQALSNNDRVSAQLVIQMRQEPIDKFAACDKELHLLLTSLSPGDQQMIECWMDGDETEVIEEYATEIHRIAEISKNLRTQIVKTVALDRQVNTRLAGEHSFYKTKKG